MKIRALLVWSVVAALAAPALADPDPGHVKVRDHRKEKVRVKARPATPPAPPTPPPPAPPPAPPVVVTPEIRGFSPTVGAPGTRVEILGANFVAGDQFLLGAQGLVPTELTAGRLVVVIPPGGASGVFTVVRGGKQFRSKDRFEVRLPPPAIAGFAPVSGAPGTVVRITGAGFAADDRAFYNHKPMEIRGRSETFLEVVVPLDAKKDQLLLVKGPRGDAQTAQPFALVRPPQLMGFEPPFGPPGTRVTLRGQDFVRGDEVRMNGRPMRIHSVAPNAIVVEIAADARTDALAIFRAGAQADVTKRPFEIVVAPTVTSFAPTAGAPGTRVILKGTAFTPDARVFYGVMPLRTLAQTDTTVEVEVPRRAASQPFRVRTRAGEATTAQSFNVQIPSEVTQVSPLTGPVGTRVWIKGRDFNPSDAFFLGALPLPIVERGPEGFVVMVPANAASGAIVWESYGQRRESRFRFEVLVPPTFAQLAPTRGPVGTQVTITGAHFDANAKVFYGNLVCSIVRRVSPGELVVAVPAGAKNSEFFWLESGGQRVKSPRAFEVVTPPAVASFAPAAGPAGTQIVLTGASFSATTVVKLNGQVMPVVAKTLPTSLTVTVPADAHGQGPLVLEDNGLTARSTGVFTVLVPPAVTGLMPLVGPVGIEVTISGERFSPKASVWFGNLACPVVRRQGSTQLIVQVPAAAKGKDALVVEDLGMRVKSAQLFEVVAPPPAPPPPRTAPPAPPRPPGSIKVRDHRRPKP